MTRTNTWSDSPSSSEMILNGKRTPKGSNSTTKYRLKVVAAETKYFVLHVDFLKLFTSSTKFELIKTKSDNMLVKFDTIWVKFVKNHQYTLL